MGKEAGAMVTSYLRPAIIGGMVVGVLTVLPWLPGQSPVVPRKVPASEPPPAKPRDLTRMTVTQRHFFLSAQRGADWLQRANKPDGRFVYGFLPALRVPMEGDQYLRQAGAAFALGRAARFFGDERSAAITRQALLTLLLETTTDPDNPQVRFTIAPSKLMNRPAATGLLLLAIHELPSAGKDLLDQGDQLGHFLYRQIQKDGSLVMGEAADNSAGEAEAIEHFSGPALHGIIRSQAHRPAPWKIAYLRQARAYYQAWWQKHKNYPMVASHTAAYTEAFAQTQEKEFAEAVFAMNDWLCTLQYQNMDPRRSHWNGGFMPWMEGKAVVLAPDIRSGLAAESLADACRTAQLAGDITRQKRYKECLESCLQFLTTLQYTEANTQHFAEWYRPLLVGGFYASAQEGNLRLDYTQHALSALVQYLQFVAELP
jgi:hypothetical protein